MAVIFAPVRSVLFEYMRIAPGVQLDEKIIVFKDYRVDRSGTMQHVSELATKEWGHARDRRMAHRPDRIIPLKKVGNA
jgi:mannose-1-phosphate guanylyltransferase